ncbi:MAG: SGNH/GDSL hydrolase family protein [Planctomycetota bacterium]|nr:SGNH/GDSL hydrolase family protein [Planctomycetota bacterium]
MEATPSSRRLLRRCALAALGAVALLETVPRFVDLPRLNMAALNPPYLDSDEDLAFEPHANLVLVPKAEYANVNDQGKRVVHDADGFRGAGLLKPKPAGVFRIACLGGSSTYGTGPTSNEATWPAVLQRCLADALPGREVEVLNGGVPTWTTTESLISLQTRVLPYEPDLVLVYHGMNDASAALWPEPRSDGSHFRSVWPVLRKSPVEPILEHSVTYLVWRRYFTDYLQRRLDGNYKAIRDYDPDYVDPYGVGPLPAVGFDTFTRNLESTVAVARAHGAEVAFVTQAVWSEDPSTEDFWSGRNRMRALGMLEDRLRAVADELEVPLIDAAPELLVAEQLRDPAGVFADDVHLTDRGAALLGALVAAGLEAQGLLGD